MNPKLYGLNDILSELDGQGGDFIDFISAKGIQAGVMRLHPGEKDTSKRWLVH
jgi:hypothetical protein